MRVEYKFCTGLPNNVENIDGLLNIANFSDPYSSESAPTKVQKYSVAGSKL